MNPFEQFKTQDSVNVPLAERWVSAIAGGFDQKHDGCIKIVLKPTAPADSIPPMSNRNPRRHSVHFGPEPSLVRQGTMELCPSKAETMKTKRDVNGSVSERSPVVLLLIDVINRFDFEGGEKLVRFAMPMARRILTLKKRARVSRIPVIYVNDNFGRWKSDFKTVVDRCLLPDAPGHQVVELLKPEADDYFVLKPKQSAFFGTPLSILLEYLRARTMILTGIAGNNCVLFTAHDAYLRNFQIIVPTDCVASETKRDNSKALDQMRRVLKAEAQVSTKIRFSDLLKVSKQSRSR